LVGLLGGKSPLGDLGMDGRITLKWILKEIDCEGLDWTNSGQGHMVGFYEHSKEHSGFRKVTPTTPYWTGALAELHLVLIG